MKEFNIFQHATHRITEQELKKLATAHGKSVAEMRRDIAHAIKDLQYTQKEIRHIISQNKYCVLPDHSAGIGRYGAGDGLSRFFLCHDNGKAAKQARRRDSALVTGFGPTNSPTAGTLSVIFRILEIQRRTGFYTHIIISDLGAFNSRKKPLSSLYGNARRFVQFIKKLGFDESRGEIRTHAHHDFLKAFALSSSVLTIKDFLHNEEATEEMYKRLNLQGNDFSVMVDKTFTVTDILLPILRDRAKTVIVVAGLEEHYYPKLARIAVERLRNTGGGLKEMIAPDASVCAFYGRLIEGLFPYVKMSKSIPESSINIGEPEAEIRRKILTSEARNEHVILQMMELASDWDGEKRKRAAAAFSKAQKADTAPWNSFKQEYLGFILKVKKLWDETESCLLSDAEMKRELFPGGK